MNAFLAFVPILLLLFCLLGMKLSASKAGAAVLLVAIGLAGGFFGMGIQGTSVALSKGLSLALYVLLIIWAAIFLYHLVDEFKAIEVINRTIVHFIQDSFVQFLMLSWLFASVLQGIAGFGVPVVIVVPILVQLGFEPRLSAAAVLLGHSWSVSFGSMGSSFFTIFLVTNLPQQNLGYAMALFDFVAMVMMGLSVCYLYGGLKYVRRGLVYVVPTSLVMICVTLGTLYFSMVSLVGLMTALAGLISMIIIYVLKERPVFRENPAQGPMSLGLAVLPYGMVVLLSLLFQFANLGRYFIAFKYPEVVTGLGYVVAQEETYAKIKLFGHPAPIILMAALIGIWAYRRGGIWERQKFETALVKTVKKCIPTSISLALLISMALVMMDSGMTHQLALSASGATGKYYPLFAPLVGILGSFITGSNTNSNVIFGRFQYTVAQTLGVDSTLMAGVQSISGSVGVSMGPTNILMASSATKLSGQESQLYKMVLGPVLLTAAVMGVLNYLLLTVFNVAIGG